MSRKTTFTFTLLLQGADVMKPRNLDALYRAGCDDATFGRRDSLYYADFDRESDSLAAAIGSAIRQIESAVKGLKVVRVEPEDLLSASAIAERTGRTRESVRLLIEAKRGPGSFPSPAIWLSSKRKLWRWSDVAAWFVIYLDEPPATIEGAAFIAAMNGALEVRRHASLLASNTDRNELAKLVSLDAQLLKV